MTTFLKACINGARDVSRHAALPTSAEAIARDAAAVVRAGTHAVHVHVRDARGAESLAADDIARCLEAVRVACPSTPLGISTGEWIVPGLERRLRCLESWRILPDFVSVNFDEDGAERVARLLSTRGVRIEIGLSSPMAADRALAAGWGDRALRILLEPEEGDMASALHTVAAIERVLDQATSGAPRLLHGQERTAWPLLEESARRGYQCRIGLEDTLLLPSGEPAAGNAALVAAAAAILTRV